MKHAVLGASSSHRWMNCPGSVRMSDGLPNLSTVYSREGTVAHDVAAKALQSGRDADVWAGTVFEVEGHAVEFLEEDAEAVQVYVDYVRRRQDEMFAATLYVEERFGLDKLSPPERMFGTADAVLVSPELFEVVDLKFGRGVLVDPTENSQLMYYALGAVVAIVPTLPRRPENFRVTIVQPRAAHPLGPVRSFDFTWDDLVEFKRDLFERAAATQDPAAPLNPGEWCRFCPAQATCPALRAETVALAQREFADLTEVEGPPPPERLDLPVLLQVLEKGPIVEGWINACRAHVQGLLEAGQEVPGWKLVDRRAQRRWANPDTAREWAEENVTEPVVESLKSPAQIEAALRDERKLTKKAAAALLEETGLVVKRSSGRKLAPQDDPAPESIRAVDEFEAIPPTTEE